MEPTQSFEADHYEGVGSVVVAGELMILGVTDLFFEVAPVAVNVWSGSQVVGTGKLETNGTFSLEVPGDLVGELELRVAMAGAAPITFPAGEPADLVVIVNRGGTNLA